MNTKTYTIIYKSISDYKNKYYNDARNEERCAIYETKTLQWIKNASIIGSITHEEAITLYHHVFNQEV